MNEERLNKLLWLIQTLPADQIVIIAEKCKGLWEVSPKVQKLISIFDKLSDEEKEQFFRNVTPCDGNPTTDQWLHEEDGMTAACAWSEPDSNSPESAE